MENYKRQAQKKHYKNRLQNLKDKIKNRLPVFETEELHITQVMRNRQLVVK